MKKKTCCQTDKERNAHKSTVRVRKATDAELAERINHIREEAYAQGFADGGAQTPPASVPGKGVAAFIEELATGKCSGVKNATLYKLTEFARERGYIT